MTRMYSKITGAEMAPVLVFFFLLGAHSWLWSQTNNPVPEKIKPSGLLYELEEVTTIQKSFNGVPAARINMLREAPDDSGRLFVIDLRGLLWQIDGEEHQLFLSIKDHYNRFIDGPGKGTGFGAFAFHPDFAENGKFYTTHSAISDSGEPDFVPPNAVPIMMQWVLVEWTMDDPSASVFSGTHRELLRVDYPDFLHGIQDIQFNPTVEKGDPDYGKLYICFGDGGSSLNFQEDNIQNKASFLGTIFRIDPLGDNSKNGQYGIPSDNPFVDEEGALGEIYCYGFRNPHRISWDRGGENYMLIGDIGEKNLEELNIGYSGANYGWGKREGTFVYDRSKGREYVYPLPDNDDELGYTYPVAQYDHDEGLAIVGGYVYRGDRFPDLDGHYIFGDIPSGRVFHLPVSDLQQGSLTEIKELNFIDEEGDRITFLSLVPGDRVDLRFGIDKQGEIYFLTKADGKVRKLKTEPLTPTHQAFTPGEKLEVFPNPVKENIQISWPGTTAGGGLLEITDMTGRSWKTLRIGPTENTVDLKDLPIGIYSIRLLVNDKAYTAKIIKN